MKTDSPNFHNGDILEHKEEITKKERLQQALDFSQQHWEWWSNVFKFQRKNVFNPRFYIQPNYQLRVNEEQKHFRMSTACAHFQKAPMKGDSLSRKRETQDT